MRFKFPRRFATLLIAWGILLASPALAGPELCFTHLAKWVDSDFDHDRLVANHIRPRPDGSVGFEVLVPEGQNRYRVQTVATLAEAQKLAATIEHPLAVEEIGPKLAPALQQLEELLRKNLDRSVRVTARIKTPQSLKNKLFDRARKLDSDGGVHLPEVDDMVGVRIAASSAAEIDGIIAQIKALPGVKHLNTEPRNPPSGYRATHVTVEVDGAPIEIQVMTLRMQEWTKWNASRVYKKTPRPPEYQKRLEAYDKAVVAYLKRLDDGDPTPGNAPEWQIPRYNLTAADAFPAGAFLPGNQARAAPRSATEAPFLSINPERKLQPYEVPTYGKIAQRGELKNLPDGIYVFIRDEKGRVAYGNQVADPNAPIDGKILGSHLALHRTLEAQSSGPVRITEAGEFHVTNGQVSEVNNRANTFSEDNGPDRIESSVAGLKTFGLRVSPKTVREDWSIKPRDLAHLKPHERAQGVIQYQKTAEYRGLERIYRRLYAAFPDTSRAGKLDRLQLHDAIGTFWTKGGKRKLTPEEENLRVNMGYMLQYLDETGGGPALVMKKWANAPEQLKTHVQTLKALLDARDQTH